MSFKVFNESLDRYCKDILKEETSIFHNDNGVDYEIIERSSSGKNCLLKDTKGNKWIVAWNCPEDNQGSWGQGHYFFDEKEAREVWENKYKNESLKESRVVANTMTNNKLLREKFENSHIVPVNLERKDIIGAILGQLSDGMWENSRAAEKYWQNAEDSDKGIVINDEYGMWTYGGNGAYKRIENPYKRMSDDDVKKFFARKLKQIVAEHSKDYNIDFKAEWNPDSTVECDYLYDGTTYGDAYKAYKVLSGSRPYGRKRKVNEPTIDNTKSVNDEPLDNEPLDDDIYDGEYEDSMAESLSRKIRRIINKLNEGQMSDEDRRDSEILRGIYQKTQERANAKLTPEEQDALDKYGLHRSTALKDLLKGSSQMSEIKKGRYGYKGIANIGSDSDINLADWARKVNDRKLKDSRFATDKTSWRKVSSTDPWQSHAVRGSKMGNSYQNKERNAYNAYLSAKSGVDEMKDALGDRRYSDMRIAIGDKELENTPEYDKGEIDHIRREQDLYRQYRDFSQQRIDDLLKRKGKQEESLSRKDKKLRESDDRQKLYDFLFVGREDTDLEGEELLCEEPTLEQAWKTLAKYGFTKRDLRFVEKMSVAEGEMLGLDTY